MEIFLILIALLAAAGIAVLYIKTARLEKKLSEISRHLEDEMKSGREQTREEIASCKHLIGEGFNNLNENLTRGVMNVKNGK